MTPAEIGRGAPDLLRCRDHWGREITLSAATWTQHVLPKRARLLGHEESVRLTLSTPDEVRHDALHANRESFYRGGALPAPLDHLLLKVVVELADAEGAAMPVGRVVTAFPTHQTKPAERRK